MQLRGNRREGVFFGEDFRVTGHLFQARFGSAAMDEGRLMTAARYRGFEPRAGAASSNGRKTGAHRAAPRIWPMCDDDLVSVAPLL